MARLKKMMMARRVGGPFGRPVLRPRPFPRKMGRLRRGIPAIARGRKRG